MPKNKQLRSCLREPIPEIFEAARILDAAISVHLMGKLDLAETLIQEADLPAIREWTESIWAKSSLHVKGRKLDTSLPQLPKEKRIPSRMPSKAEKIELHTRDGFHCKFCGIPLIRKEIRQYLKNIYPAALEWGRKNIEQHAAFQAMWLQYDHLIPHSRGGDNQLTNIVITCAPCNFGRMNYLVQDVGLKMPNLDKAPLTQWDGLERILEK